ncbi:OmpA family protein [Tenacibaculum piscium]|uniref:OmpA family protein n=1 Tax=Tenacibaculum piscium TaxID=1458515 RepID=UPI001F29C275|nr:OmpA family protein [Tenacibaculum piscium]
MKTLITSKSIFKVMLFFGFMLFFPQKSNAQFFKKLLKKAENKIEREAEKRSERRVNKKIDKEFDKVEDKIDGKKKPENQPENQKNKTTENDKKVSVKPSEEVTEKPKKRTVIWNKFDFVSGDTVIFEDNPSISEENGEFPSRWDLYKGGAEIAEVDGKPVITFITDIGNMHSKGIVPYLKDAEKDYLPEIFTIEFDAFFNPNIYNERYYVTFYDKKNQSRNGISQLTIYVNQVRMKDSEGALSEKDRSNRDKIAGWRHVSIAYTKGKFKVYLEDERLINIPHLKGNPTGLTMTAGSKGMYIKNIRIAKGGVKYYDRVLSKGKIIVNGIKFDVNKVTLKRESMGPINKIFQLMRKQPDLKFSIEGHTDTDGDSENNQKLSEGRAKTVKNKLISLGISASRLKSKGFGESKPLDNNNTSEGKANNRRVEFVKF